MSKQANIFITRLEILNKIINYYFMVFIKLILINIIFSRAIKGLLRKTLVVLNHTELQGSFILKNSKEVFIFVSLRRLSFKKRNYKNELYNN